MKTRRFFLNAYCVILLIGQKIISFDRKQMLGEVMTGRVVREVLGYMFAPYLE